MTNKSIVTISVVILGLLVLGLSTLQPTEPIINGDLITPTTNLEKFEYAVRAEELLRLQHNEMGAKFRSGEITQEQWNAYLKEFDGKSRKLGYDKYVFRALIPIPVSPNKDVTSSTPKEDYLPEPKSIEKMEQEFKTSTKFEIDLSKI